MVTPNLNRIKRKENSDSSLNDVCIKAGLFHHKVMWIIERSKDDGLFTKKDVVIQVPLISVPNWQVIHPVTIKERESS